MFKACTKCEIKNFINDSVKNNSASGVNVDLSSRIVYEKINKLEAFSKAPAGEGGRFDACVNEMKDKGYSEVRAKKICAAIGSKKFGPQKFQKMAAAGNRESHASNQMNSPEEYQSVDEALVGYERFFREEMDLKLKPIENYADIDRIRDQIWQVEDQKYRAEQKYKQLANANGVIDPEEGLLSIRVKVRKQVILRESEDKQRQSVDGKSESNTQQEDQEQEEPEKEPEDNKEEPEIDDDLLKQIMDKTLDEQIAILKKEYPDWDEEFIKDVLGVE